ncbi:hypothetical protein LguiA_023732 [Lonicera macranthoides]
MQRHHPHGSRNSSTSLRSAKQNYHHRSVSDPIAIDDEQSNSTTLIRNNEFQGLDDEQLSSMFSDDALVT